MTRPVQRQSQLITTFGPGAMVDLPTRSVLIGGLDRWHMAKDGYKVIDEPALARRLERWLRDRGRLDEGETLRLLTPPLADAVIDKGEPPGIEVTVFPAWFVCERVETPAIAGRQRRGRRLVRWIDLDAAGGRRRFRHDDGKKDEVTPLRFVGACKNGHIQDVNWPWLVHEGEPCREPMWLTEEGTSANLADLEIVCGCGASLSLRDATKPGRIGWCNGRQPWLAADAHEDCNEKLRLLTRSATNAYFPQVVTVISVPAAEDALTRIVERFLSNLGPAESPAEIQNARKFNPDVRTELEPYSDEEVFARLVQVKEQGQQGASPSPLVLEFDILASGRAQIGVNEPDARLYAETLPREAWAEGARRDLSMIRSLVMVHRLREVMCLYGFTRLEPASTSGDTEFEDLQLAVAGAPIARHADWLPAIEQFGEGLFIQFEPAHVAAWLARPGVAARVDVLTRGYLVYGKKHPESGETRFRGGPYVLLHSLAHALINEIALDCGYPASALKERIYDLPAGENRTARHGILIYTAATGAEGTLGGLVGRARRLAATLDRALERLAICSNDPVCADHEPGSAVDERALLGAACHGCLLIAETSCERRNQFLDRALLVETMADADSALWPSP